MSSSHADRNLLFGFLALQNSFIAHEELIAAVSLWLTDKSKSLAEILIQRRALAEDERKLLEALVGKHLQKHGGDAEKSLAALSSVGKVREELKKLGDVDVEATLANVATARAASDADPDATWTVDPSTVEKTRFRILRPHAAGGLGQVYVARDDELNREVALKEIKVDYADDSTSRNRFLLEAEITGGLEHPGIVPVYGLGQYADGRPYYAMRFIRGDSLKEAVERFHSNAERGVRNAESRQANSAAPHSAIRNLQSAFDSVEFRKLLGRFIDVCNAIEYAHSRGVLHRDLKPGNIMLGKFGETLVVDWGLAKPKERPEKHQQLDEQTLLPRSGSGSTATQMGSAIGTPAYMSPEQAAGRLDQLGPASDVYSLGATLYSVLTGQAPFGKNDAGDILRKVQAGEFTPPRVINSNVPRPLEAICLRAMALAPVERYPSPQALADDIERYLADEPIRAHAEPLILRTRRWLRKHPRTVAALAATLLVGLTSVIAIATIVTGKNQQLARANESLLTANSDERAARQQAEEAQRAAETVTEYLVQIFRSPDPARDGRTITMVEVLANSAEDLKDEFSDDPITKATLLEAIGHSYIGLGLYHESIPLFENSLRLARAELGGEHPDVLRSMHNLATAYQQAGRIGEALPLFEESLKLLKVKLGEEHPDTHESTNNLALAYRDAGRLQDALSMHEATLKLRKSILGEDHSDTLSSMNNLALAYFDVGRTSEALLLFEETLKLMQATLGEDHPDTLTAMSNLANAYQEADRLEDGLSMHQKTLQLRRAKLGEDHPDTLVSMNNLAIAYRDSGRLTEALPMFEASYKLLNAKLGADHATTLTTLENLAAAYEKSGRPREALQQYEELIRLDPDNADRINLLAWLRATCPDPSIRDAKRALELATKACELTNRQNWDCLDTLAAAYAQAGDFSNAIQAQTESIELADPTNHAELRARLALYQSGWPYRQETVQKEEDAVKAGK